MLCYGQTSPLENKLHEGKDGAFIGISLTHREAGCRKVTGLNKQVKEFINGIQDE